MGSTEAQPYTGPERRAAPRGFAASGVVAFARFRDLAEVRRRHPGHAPGRWYEVRNRNETAADPVPAPDSVWLHLGLGVIRGVKREDLEIRRDLRRGR